MNIIFKILSSITEIIANKAYVDFCDKKYHWANILTEIKGFDAENRLIYKNDITGTWEYTHSGHKLIASSKDVRVTTIYSDDGQRTIYESEDFDGDVHQETWFEYNAQNKLVKKKTVIIHSTLCSEWTIVDYEYNQNGALIKTIETSKSDGQEDEGYIEPFYIVDYEYNQNGVLEKTIETIERDGKKDEGYIQTFYNEKGLKTSLEDFMDAPRYFFLMKYEYDSQNNCIREKFDNGQETLYKTVVEKKGNFVIKKVYVYRSVV